MKYLIILAITEFYTAKGKKCCQNSPSDVSYFCCFSQPKPEMHN